MIIPVFMRLMRFRLSRCSFNLLAEAIRRYPSMVLAGIRYYPRGAYQEEGKPALTNLPAFYEVDIVEQIGKDRYGEIRVYLPLSLPVIATLSLFYAVGRWNGFSDALMYLKSSESRVYWPIQLLLYNIIRAATQTSEQATQEGFFDAGVSKTIQMATVMFATVPILLVYPWLQRYFVTGVTIGAVKG